MRTVANAYLESQVLTASPERLHLMVVDAAIRFARQGEEALEAGDIESAFSALASSRECVNEILTGIVADPNPELAERLKGLFVFVNQSLARADVNRNPQLVRDALAILQSHRATWQELIERLQQTRPALRGPHRVEETETANSWTT